MVKDYERSQMDSAADRAISKAVSKRVKPKVKTRPADKSGSRWDLKNVIARPDMQ
jgi:hypothetical protein